MKNQHFFLLSALSLLTQVAFAEGGDQRPAGDFGLNRRVRTENNFARVTGNISIHFDFKTVNGVITTVTTPSFYLGGRGVDAAGQSIEVDAGMDYDTGFVTLREGWVPFIARSIGNHQERTNPRSWNGTRWTTPRRHGNTHDLDYEVDSQGRLKLTTDGLTFYWIDNDTNNDGVADVSPPSGRINPPPAGTTGWPWVALGQNAMNAAALNQHSVKRVTALTQVNTGNPVNREGVLDGTTLTCLFYNGYVYSPAGAQTSWTVNQTSQVRDGRGTGYDAPQSGALAYDAIWNSHTTSFSKYRVEFPNVRPQTSPSVVGNVPRTNSVQSQNGIEMGVSRYNRETVKLNLRSFPVGYTTFTY